MIDIKSSGLRATQARIAIMNFFKTTDRPVDIQTIIDYLDDKGTKADPATVFRIMNLFTKKGITKKISFNEGKFRYELADIPEHHHLICTSCTKVESFSDCNIPALEKDIKIKKKFFVKSHALEFYGLCYDCQNKQN
jgi:Fur family transcriptional regulator, ferric uptake regulator